MTLRNDIAITPQLVADHGLKPDEYQKILDLIGREPTYTELGIFSAMWNEHCSYKSSKVHLRGLPTKAPWVIQGPGENAGVIDIGDGQAVVFKMESHNHPSFIEPYQGAATGVGGILRDVFTMGARPVAAMNALRFGAPEHEKTRHLVHGVFMINNHELCSDARTPYCMDIYKTYFYRKFNYIPGDMFKDTCPVGLQEANKFRKRYNTHKQPIL